MGTFDQVRASGTGWGRADGSRNDDKARPVLAHGACQPFISADPDARELSTLYVDFNAYFASVEQHFNPALRGKPIAVAPVQADSGCCIAASYEAKAFGVKTGVRVREARQLCPQITIVKCRPGVYVQMHHALVRAIEKAIPVHGVHSIDEISCRLMRGERKPEEAAELAGRIKRSIRTHVSETIRCSIGVGPSAFIAKIAADMQKPDGLTIIPRSRLAERLCELELIDLPGIGPRMRDRLVRKGVSSVRELLACDEHRLGQLWESVVGRRWHGLLRGEQSEELPSARRSVGHSHVLPPHERDPAQARQVALRLLFKAAARMRSLRYAAQRITLSLAIDPSRDPQMHLPIGWVPPTPPSVGWGKTAAWHNDVTCTGGCADTLELTRRLSELWETRPAGLIRQVAVTLSELIADDQMTLPLFPGEARRRELSGVIDAVNERFGRHAVYSASFHHARDSAPGGIAFSHIPDMTLPDSIGERIDPGANTRTPPRRGNRRFGRE